MQRIVLKVETILLGKHVLLIAGNKTGSIQYQKKTYQTHISLHNFVSYNFQAKHK